MQKRFPPARLGPQDGIQKQLLALGCLGYFLLIRPVLFCHFCAGPIGRLNQLTGWHLCRLFCVFANLPKFVHSPSYWYYFYKILQIVICKVISFLGPGAVFCVLQNALSSAKGVLGHFIHLCFGTAHPAAQNRAFYMVSA